MFSNFSSPEGFGAGPTVPAVHGGGSGGGVAGIVDSFLDALGRGLESGSSWDPLAGIEALGSNVHPFIVHFPIAFLAGFMLLEIAGLALRRTAIRQIASGMLYLGAIGAVAAAATGLIAEGIVVHGAAVHEILEWHERLGLTVATLAATLAVWRLVSGTHYSAMAQTLHLLLAGILSICLLFGADLGGLMVYQHGVGVKAVQQSDDHQHSHVGMDSGQ